MIPDKVIIATIKNGITPPNTSLSTPAKNATGNVVCFCPSCSTGIGTRNNKIPIKDIVINLSLPMTISFLEKLSIKSIHFSMYSF